MEKITVLIIEDDPIARKQMANIIKKEHFDVLIAENGNEGLEIFKSQPTDIVITDLKMPGINGMEVVETVKNLYPKTQVLITTAYGETETVITAIRNGVLDYLKKPLDINTLIMTMGRAREEIMKYKNVALFPTLLLADDESSTRERLANVFKKEKWEVLQAGDGKEALKIFNDNKIDAVLLDIKMPGMNGLEALHEMRKVSQDFVSIVLTGYGDESSAIRAMRDGAFNFLKKPIDLDKMILTVEKGLEKLRTERALKYRTRELELAQQIITRITPKKEIVIDFGYPDISIARDFAKDVLNGLPIGFAVVSRDFEIKLINNYLLKIIDYEPTILDEKLLVGLKKVGIEDLTHENLTKKLKEVIDCEPGFIDTIKTGKYSYLRLITLMLREKNINSKVVMIVVRGERKG